MVRQVLMGCVLALAIGTPIAAAERVTGVITGVEHRWISEAATNGKGAGASRRTLTSIAVTTDRGETVTVQLGARTRVKGGTLAVGKRVDIEATDTPRHEALAIHLVPATTAVSASH